MRLVLSVDGTDAAALPALDRWLREQPPAFLETAPAHLMRTDKGSMNVGIAAIEVLAAATELTKFIIALAKRHEVDWEPPVLVAASWPDGRAYRIESSSPQAVAEIIRALNGS